MGAAMTTFDDRENAFEAKFAHDSEMQFRAEARRNKLVGLWAAELLGKSGDDAAAYAMEVVSADFEEANIVLSKTSVFDCSSAPATTWWHMPNSAACIAVTRSPDSTIYVARPLATR